MTLQQLRYFLAAVERGSVSGAAEACFVSQPSLSEQLRRLEQGLGVALFVRTNRGLVLTDAGRLLVPRAERAVAAARDAEEAVREAGAIVSGTVAFGTFSTAHHHLLGAAIAEFRRRYPGVRLRIISRNSTETADAVRRGDLEAGLVALPVDDRGLVVGERVWTTEAVYVTADGDAPARRAALDPAARGGAARAAGGAGRRRRPDAAAAARSRGGRRTCGWSRWSRSSRPRRRWTSSCAASATRCVARTLIDDLGLADRLAWVSLDPPLMERFAFITPRGAPTSAAMTAWIAIVEQHLALDLL